MESGRVLAALERMGVSKREVIANLHKNKDLPGLFHACYRAEEDRRGFLWKFFEHFELTTEQVRDFLAEQFPLTSDHSLEIMEAASRVVEAREGVAPQEEDEESESPPHGPCYILSSVLDEETRIWRPSRRGALRRRVFGSDNPTRIVWRRGSLTHFANTVPCTGYDWRTQDRFWILAQAVLPRDGINWYAEQTTTNSREACADLLWKAYQRYGFRPEIAAHTEPIE